MTTRLSRTASAVVAVLALCPAVAAASGLGLPARGSAQDNATAAARVCKIVKVKRRATHWVRKTRRVHGHRVVVRRHGKIVYVRVHTRNRRAVRKRVCRATPAPPSATGPAPTSPPSGAIAPQLRGSPAHVMVLVEENRNRSEVIGASNMPYLNSLAAKYGNTTAWNGVSHPSLPNYLALISGSSQRVTDDGCNYSFPGIPTVGSELSAAGISWKAYMEEMPEPASAVCTFGGYAKKHNPFSYFLGTNGPNVVPATQFWRDASSGQFPAFIFLAPDLVNDGHDGTNEQVDNYLRNLIPQVLASSWYSEGGIIIITWDESNGEERIPTVVVTGSGGGKVLTTPGNHYGTLATVEDLYGLPRLGNAVGATTLAPLLK
jgi:hypothetical protein